jgi:hypothetical protein
LNRENCTNTRYFLTLYQLSLFSKVDNLFHVALNVGQDDDNVPIPRRRQLIFAYFRLDGFPTQPARRRYSSVSTSRADRTISGYGSSVTVTNPML